MASLRKRGSRWQARVVRRGYPAAVKTFTNKADAERWARQVEAEMDRGQFVNLAEAQRTTVGDLLERYAATVTPTKRGAAEEQIRLRAMRRTKLAKVSMANLSAKFIADYRDERLKTCAPATVVRDLAVLSSLFNHARREWGIEVPNPVPLVRKPSAPPGRDRVLSAAEEAALIKEVEPKEKRNPLLLPLVILALETAMRRGELLGLRRQDINLSARTAFLPQTKNGKPRYVPLTPKAMAVLAALPGSPDGRLFPISVAAMETSFRRAANRAGLRDLRFHDLRHTATSRLAERLPNVIELAAVTGHNSLQMLKRYYHPRAADLALKLAPAD